MNGMETEWKWNGEIMASSYINIWKWKWNGMEMEMEKELKICRMEFPYGKFMSFIRFHYHAIPLNSIPFHFPFKNADLWHPHTPFMNLYSPPPGLIRFFRNPKKLKYVHLDQRCRIFLFPLKRYFQHDIREKGVSWSK